jgi:hypothetical protein
LSGKLPELKVLEMVPLIFCEQAGDGREAPVLVRLMKFRGGNSGFVQRRTQSFKRMLVAGRKIDVARMVVGRATELESVFNGGVAGLNSLLREWEIAAGDRVQVRLAEVLGLHDVLTSS